MAESDFKECAMAKSSNLELTSQNSQKFLGKMAESDSKECAMAKSSNLMLKARDILATPSHEGIAYFVYEICMSHETDDFQTASALYNFCAANFPNCLTLMLLKVYRCSSSCVYRLRSIALLLGTLIELGDRGFKLSVFALHDIKPLLISCLTMQETEVRYFKILGRIVSFVAYSAMSLNNGGWDELSDCILSFTKSEPLKAFHLFLHLGPVNGKFIYGFLQDLLQEVYNVLYKPKQDRAEDWTLALKTALKVGIQLLNSEMRFDVTNIIFKNLTKSANELVQKGMEQFLGRGLEDLATFLSEDAKLYKYNREQCLFVSTLVFKIRGIRPDMKEVASKILGIVANKEFESKVRNAAIKLSPSLIQSQENKYHGAELEQDWYEHLKTLSLVEILRIFALIDLEDRSREMAFIRINALLYDHTSKEMEIDISVIRELQELLISCLWEEKISDNMFKILGQTVYHVSYQIDNFQDYTWYALRDYIASLSETKFQRAVYIFQCLTLPLDDTEFVIPVMKNLLPEINRRLNPPSEVLVDNWVWVLAFVGAFCAIIHLIEIPSYAEPVKEIAHKMIDSVRELVESGMEVGLVRRAFKDVESIVKKEVGWYGMSEYGFIKGLLWRLYAIKDMKMESKIVLWRINVILERLQEMAKELSKSELDWLNQPQT